MTISKDLAIEHPLSSAKRVCVIGGAGYVGLITGLGLASLGHQVSNVDINADRVRILQEGISPILEEDLEPLLHKNLKNGRLNFSTELGPAVKDSEIIFIAVGTPSLSDGAANVSYVLDVVEELSAFIESPKVIAIRSTVPAGSFELVRTVMCKALKEGEDFDIAMNPEFLREGNGLRDFFQPDRIVIGCDSDRATEILKELYEPILAGHVSWNGYSASPASIPLISTDPASAQMIKYVSNAFLATRISFINEVAWICESVGADIQEVVCGVSHDPRIGSSYLQAGLGFGGPCLEKDLRALISVASTNGNKAEFLHAILDRNEKQVDQVLAKLVQSVGGSLEGKTVAVYGLAFKGKTNDVRNSASLKVIQNLREKGAHVKAFDPAAMEEAKAIIQDLDCYQDPYEAIVGADALMLLSDWIEFKDLDYLRIRNGMAHPRIVDARNLLDPKTLTQLGFSYTGIGRP